MIFRTSIGRRLERLTPGQLEALEAAGELPIDLLGTWAPGEAAGLALLLPTVRHGDDERPDGFGVLPPKGAEPLVRLRARLVDVYGRPITAGTRGILGALWRGASTSSAVHRVWCTAETGQPARVVDVYDTAIAGIESLTDRIEPLTGWQIVRL